MKTPREIYAAYTIMPGLQLHQLRVAAVGRLICEHFKQTINERDVILACLFHDMGNIIKSDLTLYPDLLEPEGREYWERVKRGVVSKYGPSSHVASVAIAREIGLPEPVVSIIDRVSLSEMEHTAQGDSKEQKIAEYGDCRVGTHGIVTVKERFEDAIGRYASRYKTIEEAIAAYALYLKLGQEIETQIFSLTTITPEDINDAAVAPLIEELWEYPI